MSDHRNRLIEFNKLSTVSSIEKNGICLRFLYHTMLGRCFLKIMIQPWLSNLIGQLFETRLSKIGINHFIKKHQIDLTRFEKKEYCSFNDFFSRKLKDSSWKTDRNFLCAPCDGKLSVYKINDDLTLSIKHSRYTISSLIQEEEIANRYQEGWCFVFRLTPDDYHRYHFIDDGEIIQQKKINGVFHTVRPIAQEKYPIFSENTREITIMNTKNFQTITQIEVGALLVGKIANHSLQAFQKGEEKGTFLFGGSTIILLVEKNAIQINPTLLCNTMHHLETIVHYQDQLGVKN